MAASRSPLALAFLTRRWVCVSRWDMFATRPAGRARPAARGGPGARLRPAGGHAGQGRERGADQNRTGVRGFAGLCLTTRPRRPEGGMVSGLPVPVRNAKAYAACSALALWLLSGLVRLERRWTAPEVSIRSMADSCTGTAGQTRGPGDPSGTALVPDACLAGRRRHLRAVAGQVCVLQDLLLLDDAQCRGDHRGQKCETKDHSRRIGSNELLQ